MAIERDPELEFHKQGTLNAVTRWMATHDEGVAEWLKNVRRAYQQDRANVGEEHRIALLLLKDPDLLSVDGTKDGRIGLLDAGGATVEDVTAWSTWQDPSASNRGSAMPEEETQGNGGKAYMYRLFVGPASITGVRDGKRNAKGFEGAQGSVERGWPGFMPDTTAGREVPVSSVLAELSRMLRPYGLANEDLPPSLLKAIQKRAAFTLVEGVAPITAGPVMDADDLVAKVVRHDQSTLAIQQLQLYAIHNAVLLNGSKPLQLPAVEPYPGLEGPFAYEVPEAIPLGDGTISTTEGGGRSKGRLILQTSRENMPLAWKKLRSLWKLSYRTQHQMIGAKPVSDLVPTTPGSHYIYGTIELAALEPSYVEHGRRRPKDGPLVEALDAFVAERIKDLARQISDSRRRELDEQTLDEVQEENRKLDRFKNQFMPTGDMGEGDTGGDGPGPQPPPDPPEFEWGDTPHSIEMMVAEEGITVARGLQFRLNPLLQVRVRDVHGKPVKAAVQWHTSDQSVVRIDGNDGLGARNKGTAQVWATISPRRGEKIESARVSVSVWIIDHVLLTPRSLELKLGASHQVIAEVTNDDGERSADVYLKWAHDADDQLIVRISPSGRVRGNRLGETSITAGAGDRVAGGVWARIPVQVKIVANPDVPGRGSGHPRLLLTGRDIDPATGAIRDGDPDSPALWQEVSDFMHNIWWINVQSPEVAFAFGCRVDGPALWRSVHAQLVMEMTIQVHMQFEYTKQGDERPELWTSHRDAVDRHRVRLVPQMWEGLESYVRTGEGLD